MDRLENKIQDFTQETLKRINDVKEFHDNMIKESDKILFNMKDFNQRINKAEKENDSNSKQLEGMTREMISFKKSINNIVNHTMDECQKRASTCIVKIEQVKSDVENHKTQFNTMTSQTQRAEEIMKTNL